MKRLDFEVVILLLMFIVVVFGLYYNYRVSGSVGLAPFQIDAEADLIRNDEPLSCRCPLGLDKGRFLITRDDCSLPYACTLDPKTCDVVFIEDLSDLWKDTKTYTFPCELGY